MKKFLLALVLIVPVVLAGCANKSKICQRAETHLREWLDKMGEEDGTVKIVSYSNIQNVYSNREDSIMIYTIDVVTDNGKTKMSMPIEYYYIVLPKDGGECAAINLMFDTGSLIKIADEMYSNAPKETRDEVTREQIIDLGVMTAFQSDKVIKHIVE